MRFGIQVFTSLPRSIVATRLSFYRLFEFSQKYNITLYYHRFLSMRTEKRRTRFRDGTSGLCGVVDLQTRRLSKSCQRKLP